MKKRLQTILSHAGIASRRHAGEMIEQGMVKVDNRTVTEKGIRVDPDTQKVEVNGRLIPAEEKKYYILFNKPGDVISTAKDTHGRKKVTDFFEDIDARLYPVGRLDKDTTGLLIMTNDGELAHRLSHPRFEIEKVYRVTVRGKVSPGDLGTISRGIEVDGKVTAPCDIKLSGRSREGAVYTVTLHEGRKRQVRVMVERAGATVAGLKRVKYAGLALGRLKEGEFRELSQKEIENLRKLVT